jgi:large subunit ribosomal protein L33
MAKKWHVMQIGLQCGECGRLNYTTTRNKLNMPTKLSLKKYCPGCRKHTLHKERQKLK